MTFTIPVPFGGRTWSLSLIWMQMATTRSQKMCLGHQVCPPASQKPGGFFEKKHGRKPKGPKKRGICRCSRWWFSTIVFSFSLLLEEMIQFWRSNSIFFKNGLVGEKPPMSCDFSGFRARVFVLQNLPETLGIFSSQSSHWQTFLAVFFGENSRISLVFGASFFLLGQSKSYMYIYIIIYVCIYIYI